MPEHGATERRLFLRRSLAEAASAALELTARPSREEREAVAVLAALDHLVVLSFADRSRAEILSALDGDPGSSFAGGTDEVMTGQGAGDRFAPEMLPVHSLLARSFGRADHWRGDGRDPLLGLVDEARATGSSWCLVVDERQRVSTTLLGDPEWPLGDPEAVASAGGRLLPMGGLSGALIAGVLPVLVLVEPRSLLDPADLASAVDRDEPVGSDARVAEQLLHRVYSAVRDAERAGRRTLLVVTARGRAAGEEVPVLLIGAGIEAGARITASLSPTSLRLLHRVVSAAGRRAATDPGVLALARALAGAARPAARWPSTSPAFAPSTGETTASARLRSTLRRTGLASAPDEPSENALRRLRAAAPGASLHSDQPTTDGGRDGRSA